MSPHKNQTENKVLELSQVGYGDPKRDRTAMSSALGSVYKYILEGRSAKAQCGTINSRSKSVLLVYPSK